MNFGQRIRLFVNYSTKGAIKSTYLDKDDSPVFLKLIKSITAGQLSYYIIPKGNGAYEVILPEEGQTTNLYNYEIEGFQILPLWKTCKQNY
jgi:hypothetical protein